MLTGYQGSQSGYACAGSTRPASFSGGGVPLGSLKPTHNEVHGQALILSIDDEPTNQLVINEIVRSQDYAMHQVRPSTAATQASGCCSESFPAIVLPLPRHISFVLQYLLVGLAAKTAWMHKAYWPVLQLLAT